MQTGHHTFKLTRNLKTFFVALTVLFSSCSTNGDEKKYLSKMGIDLTDKYEIVTSPYSPAIGEELIEFKLKISNKDYKTIVDKIKSLDNFQILSNNETPNRSYAGPKKDMEIIGWKKDNWYIYEVFKRNHSGYEAYLLSLDSNNTLNFQYSDD